MGLSCYNVIIYLSADGCVWKVVCVSFPTCILPNLSTLNFFTLSLKHESVEVVPQLFADSLYSYSPEWFSTACKLCHLFQMTKKMLNSEYMGTKYTIHFFVQTDLCKIWTVRLKLWFQDSHPSCFAYFYKYFWHLTSWREGNPFNWQ